MNLERVRRLSTPIGSVLPFNLYNADGELILRKGYIVSDDKQAERLHRLQLFRDIDEQIAEEKLKRYSIAEHHDSSEMINENNEISTEEKKPVYVQVLDDFLPTSGGASLNLNFDQEQTCPFDIIDTVAKQLDLLLKAVFNKLTLPLNIEDCFFKISDEINRSCTLDADATIACILLDQAKKWSYSIKHSIDTAIVCALLAKSLKLSELDRNILMSSALTMNIGVLDIQDVLHYQQTPLTEEQLKRIKKHPLDSARILDKAGVQNVKWLKAVGQHHERIDGSGYPSAIDRTSISLFAQLVSVADIYSAVLTDRADRDGALPHVALKEIFLERGKNVHEKMSALLIKELGIYPPGSVVKLENKEIAIVIRRTENSNAPKVMVIINEEGLPVLPSRRDVSDTEFHIKEVIDPSVVGANINKYLLWGYFHFNMM